MTDHELNELRRIERLALFLVTEEDWATYQRLQAKRRREVAQSDKEPSFTKQELRAHGDTRERQRRNTYV